MCVYWLVCGELWYDNYVTVSRCVPHNEALFHKLFQKLFHRKFTPVRERFRADSVGPVLDAAFAVGQHPEPLE